MSASTAQFFVLDFEEIRFKPIELIEARVQLLQSHCTTGLLSCLISWVMNTQLNHWTKRVLGTQLNTYGPKKCPGPLPTYNTQNRATGD